MNKIDSVFKEFPILETKNLILRKIIMNDVKEIFGIYSSHEAMKYFGKVPFKTKVEAKERILKTINSFKRKEGIRWAITMKGNNKLIGSAGFWRLIKEHHRAEIGYELSPDVWRKGIMFEALSEIIKFGFDKMKFHSIEANLDPENIASIKLLEKLGFKKEGHTKESFYFEGKFSDTGIYSLLRTQ